MIDLKKYMFLFLITVQTVLSDFHGYNISADTPIVLASENIHQNMVLRMLYPEYDWTYDVIRILHIQDTGAFLNIDVLLIDQDVVHHLSIQNPDW